MTLLGGGAIDAARPILEEWRQAEPNHPEMLAYRDAIAGSGTATEGEIAPESTTEDSQARQYRLDSGVTTTEIAPIGLPIISQTSAFETMLPAENG